jgi:hypothetical protein
VGKSRRGSERRLLELLADRATFGLRPQAEKELQHLLQTRPDFDSECIDRAAATVQLALTPIESMPGAVRVKIRASLAQHRQPSQSSDSVPENGPWHD